MHGYVSASPSAARHYEHLSLIQALGIVLACAAMIGAGLMCVPA